ncbi:hypothetical protein BDN72DRAFT_961820 [Pluteus cervinus]|uniref:Uncharacterized protein n=1 Tax=Pluteus cervinus TaxID=181527 RepID=A0ACD3ALA5_9AGAR|nr:hypothetical protein BDN72DRAFT_961820 [Pluteus cervinus]
MNPDITTIRILPLEPVQGGSRTNDVDVIQETFPSWCLSQSQVSGHSPQSLMPPEQFSNPPHDNEKHTAKLILDQAWRQSVRFNTTFVVISNGNYERIAVRHRGSGTLFVSSKVSVSEGELYLKTHMGLYLASCREAALRNDIIQQRQQRGQVDLVYANTSTTFEDALSKVHIIRLRDDPEHQPQTWQRHCDEHANQWQDCGSPQPRREAGIQDVNVIARHQDSLLDFHIAADRTPFTYQGALYAEGWNVVGSLAAMILPGPAACQAMCKEFRQYKWLLRMSEFRGLPLQLPRYYGLFELCTQHNPNIRIGVKVALVIDNPGRSLLNAIRLDNYHVLQYLKILRQIHNIGFLLQVIKPENLYIALDGGNVNILGFENLRPVDVDPNVAQGQTNEEMERLRAILHQYNHQALLLEIP